MSQQVNLYQPIFRKEKRVFSAHTILALSVGLIAVLALWSVLIGQRISNLEEELQRQRQAEDRVVSQVAELRSETPDPQPDPELQSDIDRLRERRDVLERSVEALSRRVPAAEVALLPTLDTLARRIPEGLWLTRVVVADQGQTLEVSGRALEARLVPDWLQRLAEAPELADLGFRQVELNERDNGLPGVSFHMSTAAEETP